MPIEEYTNIDWETDGDVAIIAIERFPEARNAIVQVYNTDREAHAAGATRFESGEGRHGTLEDGSSLSAMKD